MRCLFTVISLLIFTTGLSQHKEIQSVKLKHFDKTDLLIKLSRKAQELNLEEGAVVKISCGFQLKEDGSLESVKARGKYPEFQTIVENHWKQLKFPNEKIRENIDYTNTVFAVAIEYTVLSKSDMHKLVRKRQREVIKESN